MAVDQEVPTTLPLPPGPKQSNLHLLRAGVMQLLGRAPANHDAIADLARSFGDVVRVRDPQNLFVVSDPELVHQVLATDGRITIRGRGYKYLALLMGNGLITSDGDEHDRNRRLVAPVFTRDQLSGYASVISDAVRDLDDDWTRRAAGGHVEVDMAEEMGGLALRIAGLTLFGVDLTQRSDELVSALKDVFGAFEHARSPFAPFLLKGPTPMGRRLRRGVDVVHRVVDDLIAEHRANPDRYAGDALSLLLQARDVDGSTLTDRQVRDEVTTLLVAGHETTANLLSWAWFNLHANPDAAALLHAELDRLAGPPGPSDAFEPALPVTRAVIAETLRTHPPAWALSRVYPGSGQFGGYQLPADTEAFTSQWVVHRDPRWWGEDADRFHPQRWLRAATPDASGCPFDARQPGHPRFAYFPFGAGRRVCIGEQFAWAEAVLCLATLARRWSPEVRDGWIVDEVPQITLRPRGGLPMTLVRRASR